MILRPWPRIFRSFPMIDLVPGSAERTRGGCCDGLREIGTPTGSGACGSAEGVRGNMGPCLVWVGGQTDRLSQYTRVGVRQWRLLPCTHALIEVLAHSY